MIFISCSPDNSYFHWQVEVYINNFMKMGVDPSKIHVLWLLIVENNYQITPEVKKLEARYPEVKFFYYTDTRTLKHYIPTTKPYLVKEHLKAFPTLNREEAIFYHDADILFTRPIDFSEFEKDDIWYMSDTIGYIGYNYVVSKGEHVLNGGAEIVGIHPEVIKYGQNSSGGAQYIMKKSTWEYWQKVEDDSLKLYEYFRSTEATYNKKHPGDYPIQSWCAEMWATLWNAWYYGYTTYVDQRLGFVFATDSYERAVSLPIFHNAGVTSSRGKMFYKGAFIDKSPFDSDITLPPPQSASLLYVEAILEAREEKKRREISGSL